MKYYQAKANTFNIQKIDIEGNLLNRELYIFVKKQSGCDQYFQGFSTSVLTLSTHRIAWPCPQTGQNSRSHHGQDATEVVGDNKCQAEETVKSYSNYNDKGDVPTSRNSSVLNVVVSGLDLFSDGYQAQIS